MNIELPQKPDMEHPYLDPERFPEGFKRVTKGEALPGDMVLHVNLNDSRYYRNWELDDGIDYIYKAGGTKKVKGIDDRVPYRTVLVRNPNNFPKILGVLHQNLTAEVALDSPDWSSLEMAAHQAKAISLEMESRPALFR